MSGCHEPFKCECNCHSTNVKFMYASNPPKPCCQCDPLEAKHDHGLLKRIEALEKSLKWNVAYADRKPHKCPLCEGSSLNALDTGCFCRACSSTGIVWG